MTPSRRTATGHSGQIAEARSCSIRPFCSANWASSRLMSSGWEGSAGPGPACRSRSWAICRLRRSSSPWEEPSRLLRLGIAKLAAQPRPSPLASAQRVRPGKSRLEGPARRPARAPRARGQPITGHLTDVSSFITVPNIAGYLPGSRPIGDERRGRLCPEPWPARRRRSASSFGEKKISRRPTCRSL